MKKIRPNLHPAEALLLLASGDIHTKELMKIIFLELCRLNVLKIEKKSVVKSAGFQTHTFKEVDTIFRYPFEKNHTTSLELEPFLRTAYIYTDSRSTFIRKKIIEPGILNSYFSQSFLQKLQGKNKLTAEGKKAKLQLENYLSYLEEHLNTSLKTNLEDTYTLVQEAGGLIFLLHNPALNRISTLDPSVFDKLTENAYFKHIDAQQPGYFEIERLAALVYTVSHTNLFDETFSQVTSDLDFDPAT